MEELWEQRRDNAAEYLADLARKMMEYAERMEEYPISQDALKYKAIWIEEAAKIVRGMDVEFR